MIPEKIGGSDGGAWFADTGEGNANAKGRLRSTIHALNNVLAVIQLNATMAGENLASGKALEGEFEEITAAVARGKQMLEELSALLDAGSAKGSMEVSGPVPLSRPRSSAEARAEADGAKRILFVDDEKELAQLGQRLLIKKGYQVDFFTDSTAAYEVFAADPQGFDLVITDQNMPGMNGIQLAGKILRLRPDIPILVCTGYSTGFSRWNFQEHGFSELLVKPYQPAELLSAIRTIFARSRKTDDDAAGKP